MCFDDLDDMLGVDSSQVKHLPTPFLLSSSQSNVLIKNEEIPVSLQHKVAAEGA